MGTDAGTSDKDNTNKDTDTFASDTDNNNKDLQCDSKAKGKKQKIRFFKTKADSSFVWEETPEHPDFNFQRTLNLRKICHTILVHLNF